MTSHLSRRRFLGGATAGAAGLAVPALTGCAPSATSAGSTGGKQVTLQVMYESNEVTPKIISDFETANPDVKISLIKNDNARLLSMLAAGQAPDLFEAVGVWDAPYWAARRKIEPLDSYLQKSSVLKVDDLNPVNDIWRFDGTKQGTGPYYGLCKDYSQDGTIWVNKTVLAKAGIALPSVEKPLSYDELLTIGRAATKKRGAQVETFGLGWFGTPRLLNLLPMVESMGGKLFSDDFTELDFTSDASLRALEWYWAVGKDALAPGPRAKQAQSDDALYAAGRVGAILAGYWFTGRLGEEKVRDTSYMLPAPQLGPTRVSPTYYGVGMVMSAESKNKDAAWRFMEYFLGGKPADERATAGWGLPGLKHLNDKLPQKQPYQQRSYVVQQHEAPYMKVLAFSPFATNGALQTVIDDKFAAALGSGDVRGFARTITSECNKLLAEGKAQVS
ncbi:extracellular solute-binding protein [Kribbella voronezhensis]|uniref:extracellular solute-binding protein n=1 Tax=Kribbella voronezhensis TaxID=2512212 RepID=UPI00106370D6|nr:extracellular solute-binding protein [Kribbella voronezhensis]